VTHRVTVVAASVGARIHVPAARRSASLGGEGAAVAAAAAA
jgi:hypothetical protein